jgi:ADP-ribose pyrophosphatase YjhB (NUDIX family)
MVKHRISGGAFVFKDEKILMVRHQREGSYDFWVAPGGGVNTGEDAASAAAREAFEEAGIKVRPLKLVAVEELGNPEERACKLWFHCELIGGELSALAIEATREHIIDAQFLSRDELSGKTVFPPILLQDGFWKSAKDGFPVTLYLGLRQMAFY